VESFCGGDPVNAGHDQIHQDHVGAELADQFKRFPTVASFPNYLQIRLTFEQRSLEYFRSCEPM
jgi:hypothetical protein